MTNAWNVRIPEAQRWMAKEAAVRERKTIAKWLGEAIEEKAGKREALGLVSENGPKNLENREAAAEGGQDAEKQSIGKAISDACDKAWAKRTPEQREAVLRGAGLIPSDEEPVPAKRKPSKPKKEPKVCEHGTRVGFNCWKCGGISKTPKDPLE